jgi:DNA-directed RNA polymerase subunit omega
MARVTVEDCIQIIPNRFDLVVTAAQRAKQISSGMPLTIDRDNDKDAVVSLREIADKTIDSKLVSEEIIVNFQKKNGFDPADVIEEEQNSSYTLSARDLEDSFNADAVQHFNEQSAANQGMSFVEENIEVED